MTKLFSTAIMIFIFSFLSSGQKNDLTELDFKGKVKSVEVTVYKETSSKKEEAKIISTHKVFYNESGNMSREIYPERLVTYYYNENGLLTLMKSSHENGTSYSKYEYDQNNNLVKRLKCTDSLQQNCYLFQQYKYDTNGNQLEETGFDEEGKQVITYYYLYNADNKLVEDGQVNSSGDTLYVHFYSYNKSGQTSKIKGEYNSTEFEYNSFGDQIKSTEYILGGKKSGQTTNEYTYDDQRNWTKIISTETHFSRESAFVLNIVRKIEYY